MTPRWTKLRAHDKQRSLWLSKARFIVVPAGRRSGKSEIGKRKLAKTAIIGNDSNNGRYFAAAPTRDQAKRIFWDDLKALVPKQILDGKPSESELIIRTITGSEIHVLGMDKPERIEGTPWDGGILDEYANMKSHVWNLHVRPALSDRNGWCWFTGVPEGRNHYYELAQSAQYNNDPEWEFYTWLSSEILPAKEIEAAKRDLDELSYKQEYEASFIDFHGRAYYPFGEETHCKDVEYKEDLDLIFCFDFNVSPGVAAVLQEQEGKTCCIGEVFIPKNSNTERVCNKLVDDWGHHKGIVYLYGDATGGSKGSAKLNGSDWEIVLSRLASVFGSRVKKEVPKANPSERARINAVNSRLKAMSGEVNFYVNRHKAPKTVRDFEGTSIIEGSAGELNKSMDGINKEFTHLTDAIGYYIIRRFPIVKPRRKPGNIEL